MMRGFDGFTLGIFGYPVLVLLLGVAAGYWLPAWILMIGTILTTWDLRRNMLKRSPHPHYTDGLAKLFLLVLCSLFLGAVWVTYALSADHEPLFTFFREYIRPFVLRR